MLVRCIMQKTLAREPINSYTHLFGAILALVGTIALLVIGKLNNHFTGRIIVACSVFGLSLTLLSI